MFKLRATVLSPLFSSALLCVATLHAGVAVADWSSVSSNKPTFLAPTSSATVYAADSSSIYGSSDGGKTWSTLGTPTGAPYTALAYLGSNLWVGTDKTGTSYSSNGTNWTLANNKQVLVFTGTAKRISGLSSPSAGTLLAANSSGIYRSTDNGSTWDETPTGLPMVGIAPFLVKGPANAIASNSSASVAATDDGIYRSTDGGSTWSKAGLSGTVSTVFAVPGSSTFLAILGSSAYRSTDNGANWSALSGLSGGTPTAFAAHPTDGKTLYVGTNAGAVLQSSDGGATWTVISDATLANLKIQALAVPASDPTSLVAATSGGTFLFTAGPVVQPAFSFSSRTGVTPKDVVVSDAITVTGLTAPASISIQGGEYSINGGAYTSAAGIVTTGAKVTVRVTASSAFASTTSATLTIGKNSAKFEVTTQSFTAITTPTELLSTTPSGVNVVNGVLQVTTPTTLDLKPSATTNAIVQIPVNTPVTVVVGGNSATVTPTDNSANFTTRTIINSSGQTVTGLALSGGSANIVSTQPLTLPISSGGSSSLQFGSGASLQLNASGGSTGAGVISGSGTISAPVRSTTTTSANRFAASSTTVYGGENFTIDQDGYLKELRIGSLKGDQGVAGDPLALANLDSGVKVPKLDGNLNRLSSTASLVDVIKGALDTQFAGSGTASYDVASGIFTYTLAGKTYRFIPLGSPTVALSSSAPNATNFAATNAASAASGAFSLTNRGVQLTLTSALGYFTELDQAIKGYDQSGSFKLRSDGSLKLQLLGLTAVAAPGSAVTAGTATGTPTFGVDADNRFTFIDSKGSSQTFYPVFADTDVVNTTLKELDSKVVVTNQGNGSTDAVAPNWKFTFKPDYFLSTPDAAHANDLWWVDGSKVVLRYPDNTTQSFGF